MEDRVSGMLISSESLINNSEYICLVESLDSNKSTIKEGLELMEVKVLEVIKAPSNSLIKKQHSIKIVISNK